MTGEISFFRKRFLGGFNAEDVIGYITKMAQERSELEAAKEKAENDARLLAREVAALRIEAKEATQLMREEFEKKIAMFDTAGDAFVELETQFGKLRSDIEIASSGALAALKNTSEAFEMIPAMLAKTAERFGELRAAFDVEKDGALSGEVDDNETEEKSKLFGGDSFEIYDYREESADNRRAEGLRREENRQDR